MFRSSKMKFVVVIVVILAVFAGAILLLVNGNRTPEQKYISEIQGNNIVDDVMNIEKFKLNIDKLDASDTASYIVGVNEILVTMKATNNHLMSNANEISTLDSSLLEMHQNLVEYALLNQAIISKIEALLIAYKGLGTTTSNEELEAGYTNVLQLIEEMMSLTNDGNTYKNNWLDAYNILSETE